MRFVPGVLHHVFNQAACAQQPRFLTRWPANATNIIGRSKSQAALDIPIATKSIHLPSSEPNQLAIPHTAKKTTEKEQLPPTQRTCNWCCSPLSSKRHGSWSGMTIQKHASSGKGKHCTTWVGGFHHGRHEYHQCH